MTIRGILTGVLMFALGAAFMAFCALFDHRFPWFGGPDWQRAGDHSANEQPQPVSAKRDRALRALAEAAVERVLYDPSSAQFEGLRIVRPADKTERVCGVVNAKNRFGAYVGRQPFIYELLLDSALISNGESEGPDAVVIRREIATRCQE